VFCISAAGAPTAPSSHIHNSLRDKVRDAAGRDPMPSTGVVDAQSVKGADTVSKDSHGFDAAQKVNGRKWHIVTDTLGLLLIVMVTAAGVQDRDGGTRLLERLRFVMPSVVHIWADGGYAGRRVAYARQVLRRSVEIVRKPAGQRGFEVLTRRWVVERTFAWIMRCRRLVADYERLPEHAEAMVKWTMIGLMSRRLAPAPAGVRGVMGRRFCWGVCDSGMGIRMKASREKQTGSVGVSGVCADFERIGWGPVRNSEHDLGTDLFVQARDNRLFDRGLVVGVQVKGGPSWFESSEFDDAGKLVGWWYYERGVEHFDDWVTHSLPHMVVLHDLDARISYWVHVTADAVKSTGKGCKILVPFSQTVDEAHRDALFAVAASQKPAVLLEGSAWRAGAAGVPPGRRLRYALLAPRLVAPHRNTGHSRQIGAEEAVALLALGRMGDLSFFADRHETVPAPQEAMGSRDWRWRFVGALWEWTVQADPSALVKVLEEAPHSNGRAAAGVAAACALLDQENHHDALALLTTVLEDNHLAPVDWAWARVQRARVLAELGEVSTARADAVEARKAVIGDASDVTASEIAAAAAGLLWATSDWEARDLGEVLSAGDTAVSWWRAQTLSHALDEAAKRAFREWSDEPGRVFVIEDGLHNGLFAAMLNAHLAGEHGAWRARSSLLARHVLMDAHKGGEADRVAEAIDDLRKSGDAKSVGAAARRIWQVGPLEALAVAVGRIGSRSWTHTASQANFTLWKHAGDLLEADAAKAGVQFCLSAVGDELCRPLTRARRVFRVDHAALEALAGLLPAVDCGSHSAVTAMIAGLPVVKDELFASGLAKVVRVLAMKSLSAAERDALREAAVRQPHTRLSASILGRLAAAGDANARTMLSSRIANGDLEALAQIGSVTVLSETAVDALLDRLEPSAEQLQGLAVLNVWFPQVARWDPLLRLLADPTVPAQYKHDACRTLAETADRLPDEVRHRLIGVLDSVAATEPDHLLGKESIRGVVTHLLIALGATDATQVASRLAELAMSTWQQRRDLARILGSVALDAMPGALAVLASDPYIQVRAAAGKAAATRLRSGRGGATELRVITQLAVGPGAATAQALLGGLFIGKAPLNDDLHEVAVRLRGHRSARVRALATRLLLA
jgi:transposase